MAPGHSYVDERTGIDLYDYSHDDPDCGHVTSIYFCFCVGAVRQFMETASSQLGNSWLLHLDCSANHLAHDAKNEKINLATYSPLVICTVRARSGSHTDKRQ